MSTRDGNQEVYAMNADGSAQTNLTRNPTADERDPRWSPDGTTIVFNGTRSDNNNNEDIYLMNADGFGMARVTAAPALDRHLAWSPDGRKIVFRSTRSGNSDIFMMEPGVGAEPAATNLTKTPAVEYEPAW